MSQNTFQKVKLGKILNRLRADTASKKQQKDLFSRFCNRFRNV